MVGLSIHIWLSLVIYMTVALFTPGPNNLMLMASGSRFGFARTLPHMAGVAGGFAVLMAILGLGLARVFSAYPVLYTILKYGGLSYILYLAYRLATAEPNRKKNQQQKNKTARAADKKTAPWSVWQAAAFQWINPKGMVMAVSVFAIFLPPDYNLRMVAVASGVTCFIGFFSSSLWAMMGASLTAVLRHGKRQHYFNLVMAGLLLLSVLQIFF